MMMMTITPLAQEELTPPNARCQGKAFNALLQAQLAEINELIANRQLNEATALLKNWQAQSPEEGAYPYQLGKLILEFSQEPAKAKLLFDLALQADPENASYWVALAQASVALKEDTQAFQLLKQALVLEPENTSAFAILAPLLQAHGYTEEAVSTYEQWLAVQPELADVYITLAQLYQTVQLPEEALQTLERATVAHPENPLLFFLKGAMLQGLKGTQSSLAQEAYEKALALGGNQPELHEAMAQFYTGQLDYTKAIQHWVAVLELRPEAVEPLQALATLLQQLGRTTQSVAVLNKLLTLNPKDARTQLALAHAFSVQGLVEEALVHYNQALDTSHDAGIELRKLFTVPVIHPSEASIKATHHRALMGLKALSTNPFQLENPLVQVGDTPFYLLQQGETVKSLLEQYHTLLQKALPTVPSVPAQAVVSKQMGKKRVGVVTRSFQAENKLAWAIQGLFTQLPDSLAETIEIVFFCVGQPLQWVAGVTKPTDEDLTVIQLSTSDWLASQEAIIAQNLDVLLYIDVNQDPVSTFLAHRRLAPKQGAISFSGVTTGCKATVDFLLLPEMPYSAVDFSEKTVATCTPWLPLKRLGENAKLLKQDFGVLYDDVVWLLPQAPYRIGLEMDAFIAQALAAVPKAKLLVLPAEETAWNEQFQARWQVSFPSDVLEKVIFLGHLREADKLQLFNVVDLVLDSFPASEPLTALQALNYGTPVLTLQISAVAHILASFIESTVENSSLLLAQNPTAWAENLIQLSTSAEGLANLKTAFKKQSLSYFSPLRQTQVKTDFWQALSAQWAE
jgi:tetratricopeptide (TPR) repeat protein